MECPNCHWLIPPGAAICPTCGEPVTVAQVPTPDVRAFDGSYPGDASAFLTMPPESDPRMASVPGAGPAYRAASSRPLTNPRAAAVVGAETGALPAAPRRSFRTQTLPVVPKVIFVRPDADQDDPTGEAARWSPREAPLNPRQNLMAISLIVVGSLLILSLFAWVVRTTFFTLPATTTPPPVVQPTHATTSHSTPTTAATVAPTIAATALPPTATTAPVTTAPVSVDDSVTGTGVNQFNYQGNWQHCTACGANQYQGTSSYDNTAGDVMTFTFTGTQILFYGVQDAHHGLGAISIDGGQETQIDFYAAQRTEDVLMWTSPTVASGQHTLKLRVLGQKNPASTDAVVAVDRVTIKP